MKAKGRCLTLTQLRPDLTLYICTGLWYLSSRIAQDDTRDSIWIEVRDSQWKAEGGYPSAEEEIPFNLCQFSHRAKPGHVNRQTIPVSLVILDKEVTFNVSKQRFTQKQGRSWHPVVFQPGPS